MNRIGILTCNEFVEKRIGDWYSEQIYREDDFLSDALQDLGVETERVSWSSQKDWSKYSSVVFRSVWDYQDKLSDFKLWLESVGKKTELINSYKLIMWNLDKHYLSDFAKAGFLIIPSIYIDKHNYLKSIQYSLEIFDSEYIVAKPCISAGARNTFKLNKNSLAGIEYTLGDLIQKEDYILQPFFDEIQDSGEISHIVIGGRFTHSVKKNPAKGDFRVQQEHGGKVSDYTPNQKEIDFAESIVRFCPEPPLYARVDCVVRNEMNYLMELELIEPELYFRYKPEAALNLAEQICRIKRL